MTPHDHSTFVPGCFRCELSRDEVLCEHEPTCSHPCVECMENERDRFYEALVKLRGAVALEIAECAKQGDVDGCTTCREVYHPMLAVADKALLS